MGRLPPARLAYRNRSGVACPVEHVAVSRAPKYTLEGSYAVQKPHTRGCDYLLTSFSSLRKAALDTSEISEPNTPIQNLRGEFNLVPLLNPGGCSTSRFSPELAPEHSEASVVQE
eukprot:scaffold7403_cov277-Pinguiococcus_pyrenoidosus.AAC.4